MINFCYIRFGDLPPGGKSQISSTGRYERGVSVYGAVESNGIYNILFPCFEKGACIDLLLSLSKPMYLVTGDVIDTGSTGEPVLENCKIVKRLDIELLSDKLFFDGIEMILSYKYCCPKTYIGWNNCYIKHPYECSSTTKFFCWKEYIINEININYKDKTAKDALENVIINILSNI